MTDEINKDSLKKLATELNLHYKFDKSHDCYVATFPGTKIKDEDGYYCPVFLYDPSDDYAYCRTCMRLEYNSHSNNLKIMWGGDDEAEEIWSLKELRKHCKNLVETYNQFTFYKKQFGANKRIVSMKKDFE